MSVILALVVVDNIVEGVLPSVLFLYIYVNEAPCGVNAGCAFKLTFPPAKTITEPVKSIVGGSTAKQLVCVLDKVLL